jgi:hypothetical protein
MALWRRAVLSGLAAALASALLAACGNGGGLRVEGPETPPPDTPTPALAPGTASASPSAKSAPQVAVDLNKVRLRLLADKRLSSYARTVLSNCTVISRCLSRGTTVDVMHSGTPQQIVLIHTLEKFVFGIFLIAVQPSGPVPVWSLSVEQPTVTASPQGNLVVESKIFAIDDPVCCPSGRRVEVYRWNGRQMTKVSSTDQ